MFFSVIIPNYNHGRFLEKRIQSVLNQTYNDFEVIILDDASTDNSKEIILKLKDHPKVQHLSFNETNSGSPYLQWKKGIALAKADWIWIAESDDLSDENFLKAAVEILQKRNDVCAYYCDSLIIDEEERIAGKASEIKNNYFQTQKWSRSYEINGIDELNQALKFLCTINNTNALVFKKDLFEPVKNKIAQYRYFGDWFFFMNVALQTTIYYNCAPLAFYRDHANNFIGKNIPALESNQEYFQLLIFLLSRKEITDQPKLIKHFSRHYLGWGWIKHGMKPGIQIMNSFLKTDKGLAKKVIPKMILNRILRKKNKTFSLDN